MVSQSAHGRIVVNTDGGPLEGKQTRHRAGCQKGRAPKLLSIGPKGGQKKLILGVELRFTVQSAKLRQSNNSNTAAHKCTRMPLQMEAAHSPLAVYRSTASAPGQRVIAVLNGAKDVRVRRRERLNKGSRGGQAQCCQGERSRSLKIADFPYQNGAQRSAITIKPTAKWVLTLSLNPKPTTERCARARAGKPGCYLTSCSFHIL